MFLLAAAALVPAVGEAIYFRDRVSWQSPISASELVTVDQARAWGDGAIWVDARPDDEFARGLGSYADLAALRSEIRKRLERNALDRARHIFADRIIDFATANATVELPDLLIEREQEVWVKTKK